MKLICIQHLVIFFLIFFTQMDQFPKSITEEKYIEIQDE